MSHLIFVLDSFFSGRLDRQFCEGEGQEQYSSNHFPIERDELLPSKRELTVGGGKKVTVWGK